MDSRVVILLIVIAVLLLVLVLVVGVAGLLVFLLWARAGREEKKDASHPHRGPTPPPIAQMLGLHPTIAFSVVIVDVMLTALDITGVGWSGSCLVAGGLGYACYLMQRNSYGDTHDAAVAKGIIVGVLTAIPTPLPSFLTASAGAVGGVGLLLGCGKKVERLEDKRAPKGEAGPE
jgi:hypothetical protein